MSSNIIQGKGRKRVRNFDDEWDEIKDNSSQHDDRFKDAKIESVPQTMRDEDKRTENVESRVQKPDKSMDEFRDKSRAHYLKKRQQDKLEQLRIEIDGYENRYKQLSDGEKRDLERKREILRITKERDSLAVGSQDTLYRLPESYVNEDGMLDRRRKAELLNAKYAYEEDGKKKNRYENQWEQDQLRKAYQGNEAPEVIQIPSQKEYEFVFDESEFIDFDQDQQLEDINDEEIVENSEAKTQGLKDVRQSLPVFKYRERFLETLSENQVMIIVGETGSGKTTQLPQYLYEAGYAGEIDGKYLKIACTQPRRVAATSVARRVSEEMNVKLGEEVGYSIRFEDKSSDKTIIKYVTDGMLLREFLSDPELTQYGALMIDEAHERTVSTEILLSLLKDIIKERKDLKLIIASATINAKKFSDFFDQAPIFNIPGRRFPVDIHYTKNPEANYIQAAITTIFQIHTAQELPGDILVFLTGQDEIESMEESLNDSIQKLGSSIKPLIVCSIYANLPADMQSKIFEHTPPDSRKIVLATNIAETSITIDGIKYVIDPGYVKQNVFNAVTGMESLVVVPCSKASANQRAGRAGRVGPGKCFRLYTKWSFHNELEENPVPEILRVNLVTIILLLLSFGINDLVNFDFMDPPSSDSIIKSLELLYALGALNSKGQLTSIGRKMVEFPIDPMFSKSLITSANLKVLEEMVALISVLGESSNLFYRPKDKKEQADKRKEGFNKDEGDHFTLLNIWEQWVDSGFSSQWCEDNFIQYKTLKRVRDVKSQLERLCSKLGIEVEESSQDVARITKVASLQRSIVSGFFPNVCILSRMGDSYRKLKKNQVVYIHPSSSLYATKPPPKLILYYELVLTSKEYMRNCIIVEAKWIKEYGSHYFNQKELDAINPKCMMLKSIPR